MGLTVKDFKSLGGVKKENFEEIWERKEDFILYKVNTMNNHRRNVNVYNSFITKSPELYDYSR